MLKKDHSATKNMTFYRTLLAYLYPKTRKKTTLSLVVVALLFVVMVTFQNQRNSHRKVKNEALASGSHVHEIHKQQQEDGISRLVDDDINSLENKKILNSLLGGQVLYNPGDSAHVEYLNNYFNASRPPDACMALVFTDSERAIVRDKLKFMLKSLKINFDFLTWNRFDDNYLSIPHLIDKYGNPRYQAIIFTNDAIFDNLDSYSRGLLEEHCKKFKIGVIIFTHPIPMFGMIRSLKLMSLPLALVHGVKDIRDVEIKRSPSLSIVKSGNILKGPVPGNHHILFQTTHPTFEPVVVVKIPRYVRQGNLDRLLGNDDGRDDDDDTHVLKGAIVLQDKGERDGIRKVIFGVNFWDSWLYQLVFVDALMYVSNTNLGYDGLKRYIQIDIDDVFVGKTGRRLVKEDVKKLVAAQNYFSKRIPGFQFNLGFSSHHFKNSEDPLELEGDEYIVTEQVSKHFRWFDHTAGHIKPHQHTEEELLADFESNKQFAKKYNLKVDYTYSVAPHHSGVYPLHIPLFSAWKKSFGVQVTSTEGYPHLYPANGRRGFLYDDVMILPRQTCGLFTKTLSEANHPKGPTYLYDLTQGGELFWTVVFTPVNVFMTHACNYGMKERLGIALFTNLTTFIEKWTNLKLVSGTPVELAKKHFELFPKQLEPIWTDPCTDLRHQKIWNKTEKLCNGGVSSRLADILIVGPQKTGTTALLTFLSIHPDIVRSRRSNRSFEEVQFFNKNNYKKGIDWYIDFFPDDPDKGDKLYVDKSANYFDSLKAPQRAHGILPDAKIIVISTDPKRRAYSWYQHMLSKKDPIATTHTFYQVISGRATVTDEAMRIKFWMLHNKCLLPGRYADALERWLQYYDSSKILIVDGDELKEKPVVALRKVQAFLELSSFDFGKYIRYDINKKFYCLHVDGKSRCLGKGKGRHYEKMKAEEEQFLSEYYHVPNLRLNDLLKKIHKPLPKWLQRDVKGTTN